MNKRIWCLIILHTIVITLFGQNDDLYDNFNASNKVETEEKYLTNEADRMPRFPGCEHLDGENKEKKECGEEKLFAYIYKELSFPKKALKKNTTGTVVIGFTVERDGSLSDLEILRDIGRGCGKEALRVMLKMRDSAVKWIPAVQHGKYVRVRFNLPIKFGVEYVN